MKRRRAAFLGYYGAQNVPHDARGAAHTTISKKMHNPTLSQYYLPSRGPWQTLQSVFTQPRPEADMRGSKFPQCKLTFQPYFAGHDFLF